MGQNFRVGLAPPIDLPLALSHPSPRLLLELTPPTTNDLTTKDHLIRKEKVIKELILPLKKIDCTVYFIVKIINNVHVKYLKLVLIIGTVYNVITWKLSLSSTESFANMIS